MDQRGIFVDDVLFTIMNGIVIEDYPEDKPYPSCLVLCSNVNGRPIHVVVSTDDTMIFLITAYVPNPEKWNEDFTKRK